MDRLETQALLTFISTLDQRKMSDDVIDSWSRLLRSVEPWHAREAVEEHFRNQPDKYLSVGHVVAGAKRVKEAEAQKALSFDRRSVEESWVGEPAPLCEPHGVAIHKCDPCCGVLAEGVGDRTGDELHRWAAENALVREGEL